MRARGGGGGRRRARALGKRGSGAFLIWFGLAAGDASLSVLALTLFYVIPVCLLNIRAKERMLRAHYGASRARVGGFLPRPPGRPREG